MRIGLGKDSHRFDFDDKEKALVLGGVIFDSEPALSGNSDADVVLHAITNAISGITCKNILGSRADKLCLEQGITDSTVYLKEALSDLEEENLKIIHLSISIECKFPKITPKVCDMRNSIAQLLNISEKSVGITATTGEDLTPFGQGLGIECIAIITIE